MGLTLSTYITLCTHQGYTDMNYIHSDCKRMLNQYANLVAIIQLSFVILRRRINIQNDVRFPWKYYGNELHSLSWLNRKQFT